MTPPLPPSFETPASRPHSVDVDMVDVEEGSGLGTPGGIRIPKSKATSKPQGGIWNPQVETGKLGTPGGPWNPQVWYGLSRWP